MFCIFFRKWLLANKAQSNNIGVVAVSSNDASRYPQDGPQEMRMLAKKNNFEFPYLYDQNQIVAKAYQAACTPDFFLFDHAHKLVYRGQFDGSRPGNDVDVSGSDLGAAIDALLSGGEVSKQQIPSIGCSIKWLPNNKPDYV